MSRKALAAGFAGKITMYSPAACVVPLKESGIGRWPPVFQLIRAVKNRWPLAGPPPVVEETSPEPPAEAPPPAAAADVRLSDSEAPEPAPPPVQKIIRQIKTVLIEVPLCDNPPGLDGTPSFCKAHVNLQFIRSRSPTGQNLLHRLWWGLKETGTKLGTGRKAANRNAPVVWLIEQLEERV